MWRIFWPILQPLNSTSFIYILKPLSPKQSSCHQYCPMIEASLANKKKNALADKKNTLCLFSGKNSTRKISLFLTVLLPAKRQSPYYMVCCLFDLFLRKNCLPAAAVLHNRNIVNTLTCSVPYR